MVLIMAMGLFCSAMLPAQEAPPATATITGKALNVDTFQLGAQAITPDADGGYSVTVAQPEASYLTLRLGRQSMEVAAAPGDRIGMDFDGQNLLESVVFDGDRANLNRYLADYQRRNASFRYAFFGEEPEAFLIKAGEHEVAFHKRLAQWTKTNGAFQKPFSTLETTRIGAWFADIRLHYRDFYRHFPNPQEDCPPQLRAVVESINFNDASALKLPIYTSFLRSFLEKAAQSRLMAVVNQSVAPFPETRAKVDLTLITFTNPQIRTLLLEEVVAEHFENYGSDYGETLLKTFRSNSNDATAAARLQAKFEEKRGAGEGAERIIYKRVDGIQLEAFIVRPEGAQDGKPRPAMAIFHGGGWKIGTARWGVSYAKHFAAKGYVAVSFQYRLLGRHATAPAAAVLDARSAIRWLRTNATKLNINPDSVVALGWSAGGHIAASAAMVQNLKEPGEDTAISSAPNALVLLYPALDLAKDNWFNSIQKGDLTPAQLSPAEFIRPNLPPMMIAHGTRDRIVPYSTITAFTKKMKEAGNRCDLNIYEGAPHLFNSDPNLRDRFIKKTEAFLADIFP